MIINNNSVEQINIALLDLEKKLSTIKDDKAAINSLNDSISIIKASLNETKAGLTSGGTYNINISGNATTATTATTAGSAVSAELAERASKDGNGNIITGTYATKEELACVNNELNIAKKSIVPVGVIYPFGGDNSKVPDGYLLCDGREVSRTKYSALFNVIGTSFGNGDTINTFNVPDLRGRFPEGANGNLGNRIEAGLPNITASATNGFVDHNLHTALRNLKGALRTGGALPKSVYTSAPPDSKGYYYNDVKLVIDASKGETKTDGTLKTADEHHVYGTSDTVQPPAVCVNYIIKY